MERAIIEILGFHLVSNIQDKNRLTTEKGPNGIIVLRTVLWGILCRSVEIGCPMPPSQKMQRLWIALKIMIHKPLKHCYGYQNRYLFS